MAELTIFVPTRGRPENLLDFGGEFDRYLERDTKLVFVFDEDDQDLPRYKALNDGRWDYFVAPVTRRGMVGALNAAFNYYLRTKALGFSVGFMGDDHRPRTPGWDYSYIRTLQRLRTGFVYGNDLFQGANMPTQVAFTTDVATRLGYMCPPIFDHLCVDVVWKDWGDAIDRIEYLDKVIIEHMHPLAGKNRMDREYRAVNNTYIARHDGEAYKIYKEQGGFESDVKKLRELL